jgi:hypothetical protein
MGLLKLGRNYDCTRREKFNHAAAQHRSDNGIVFIKGGLKIMVRWFLILSLLSLAASAVYLLMQPKEKIKGSLPESDVESNLDDPAYRAEKMSLSRLRAAKVGEVIYFRLEPGVGLIELLAASVEINSETLSIKAEHTDGSVATITVFESHVFIHLMIDAGIYEYHGANFEGVLFLQGKGFRRRFRPSERAP